MKNIGQYNQDLSVPRKKDIDSLETRVKTNEDNIAMAESDIEGLTTDISTLKTDVSSVKTALGSKQDTIVGAASTIVKNNLTKNKILVADDNGKVSASEYISDDGGLLNVNGQIQILDDMTIYSEDQTEAISLTADGTDNIRLVASDSGSTGSIECFFYPSSNKILFRHSNDNVTLTGIADATSDNDAVNLSQLNEVKKSIPSSSNFVKKTGDTMTGSLTVNGNITASTVSYPKLIVRPTASGAGEGFMESSGHSTSVVARNVVDNNSNSRTLLIKDSVNAATLDDAIQLVDRVSNTSKNYNIIHAGNIANYGGQIVSVISDTGGTFTYLGSVTTKLYYYKFTSQYNLPNPAILLDISIPYSPTIGVFKVMCSYIQNYTPATIWFMSMNYVTDFTHDSSTKIYYIAT
jgi:hypothetical protein